MEKKDIVGLEREMFGEVSQWVIRPINERLKKMFLVQVREIARCIRREAVDGPEETSKCVEEAERVFEREKEKSGNLLTNLEVDSPEYVQRVHSEVSV